MYRYDIYEFCTPAREKVKRPAVIVDEARVDRPFLRTVPLYIGVMYVQYEVVRTP